MKLWNYIRRFFSHGEETPTIIIQQTLEQTISEVADTTIKTLQNTTMANNSVINVDIQQIVENVMKSITPTLAESIAKAIAPYVAAPIEATPDATASIEVAMDAPTPSEATPTPSEAKVTIFEYSEKSIAIVGFDGRKDKDMHAKVTALAVNGKGVKFCPKLLAYHDETGWVINKKCADIDLLKRMFEGAGYEVVLGQSVAAIKAEIDARRKAEQEAAAPAPKAEATPAPKVEPKVVPLATVDMNVKSYGGTIHLGKSIVKGSVTQIPSNHKAYFYTDEKGTEVVCIYCKNNHFVAMGTAKTTDGKKLAEGGVLVNHDLILACSQNLCQAVADGKLKVAAYMIEAYKAAGYTQVVEFLQKKLAA